MIENNKLQDLSSVKSKFIYKVERGDNLKSIADKFHTSQHALIVLNNLEDELLEGEYILIEFIEGDEYIVMPEDTIESISQYDRDRMQKLLVKNKISSIHVGQKIYK